MPLRRQSLTTCVPYWPRAQANLPKAKRAYAASGAYNRTEAMKRDKNLKVNFKQNFNVNFTILRKLNFSVFQGPCVGKAWPPVSPTDRARKHSRKFAEGKARPRRLRRVQSRRGHETWQKFKFKL